MKKMVNVFLSMFLLLFLLVGCGKTYEKYIAVQFAESDMWSIRDIDSGEILWRDAFEYEPSRIGCNGVFYVYEDGGYNFYNVKDVQHPLNSKPYDAVTVMSDDGIAVVNNEGEPIKLVNSKGEEFCTLPDDVELCSKFVNGYALVMDNSGMLGSINEKGELVVKMEYDEVAIPYDDNIFVCRKGDYADAINLKGEKLFTFSYEEYDDIGGFSEGYLPKIKNGKIVFLNKKGEVEFSIGDGCESLSGIRMENGHTIFYENGLYGIADKEGNVTVPAKYKTLSYKNGFYVSENDVINHDGESQVSFSGPAHPLNSKRFLRVVDGGMLYVCDNKGIKISDVFDVRADDYKGNGFVCIEYTKVLNVGRKYIEADMNGDFSIMSKYSTPENSKELEEIYQKTLGEELKDLKDAKIHIDDVYFQGEAAVEAAVLEYTYILPKSVSKKLIADKIGGVLSFEKNGKSWLVAKAEYRCLFKVD